MTITDSINTGSTVKTRFGWMGEVEAIRNDSDLVLVVERDDASGRALHTAWERKTTLVPIRTMTAAEEEMCARCGVQMVAGDTVADVDTPDVHGRHNPTYPYSVADWATAHASCVV